MGEIAYRYPAGVAFLEAYFHVHDRISPHSYLNIFSHTIAIHAFFEILEIDKWSKQMCYIGRGHHFMTAVNKPQTALATERQIGMC